MSPKAHTAQRIAVLALVAVAIGSGVGGPASSQESALRLTAVDSTTPGTLRMVAVVPPALSQLTLAATDFKVRQGDSTLRPKVTRLADRGMQIVIVPDQVVSQADLSLELATSIELVHLLPDTASVRTLADADGTRLTGTRDSTMRTLSGITTNRSPSAAAKISGSTLDPPLGIRRAYVLITSCQHPQPTGDVQQLKALLDPQNQQLDVVQIGPGCSSTLADLAQQSGGSAVSAPDGNSLAMAADQISRELTGQYQLVFTAASTTTPVTVAVSAMQVNAQASIHTKAAAPVHKSHGNLWLLLIVVGLLVAIAAVAFTVEIARTRRAG